MNHLNRLGAVSDKALLEKFSELIQDERLATVEVISHLAEIGRRKLYLREGYDSLFRFCVEKYHLSEAASYKRITASRLSQRFPEVLSLLKAGKINLTTLSLMSKHLNEKNKDRLFMSVQNKTKIEVETICVNYQLRDENVIDRIRSLPLKANHRVEKQIENQMIKVMKLSKGQASVDASKNLIKRTAKSLSKSIQLLTLSGESLAPKKIAVHKVTSIAATRVKIEFEASSEFSKKLNRAREVLSHKYPQARLEDIFNEALELFLEKKDPSRTFFRMKNVQLKPQDGMAKKNDSASTRYIPQEIRRQVFKRDHGACVYRAPDGKRCGEKAFVELDHIRPFALGGKSTAENLQLLCRAHNRYRAEQTFGVLRS